MECIGIKTISRSYSTLVFFSWENIFYDGRDEPKATFPKKTLDDITTLICILYIFFRLRFIANWMMHCAITHSLNHSNKLLIAMRVARKLIHKIGIACRSISSILHVPHDDNEERIKGLLFIQSTLVPSHRLLQSAKTSLILIHDTSDSHCGDTLKIPSINSTPLVYRWSMKYFDRMPKVLKRV